MALIRFRTPIASHAYAISHNLPTHARHTAELDLHLIVSLYASFFMRGDRDTFMQALANISGDQIVKMAEEIKATRAEQPQADRASDAQVDDRMERCAQCGNLKFKDTSCIMCPAGERK